MYSLETPSPFFNLASIDGVQEDYLKIPLKDRPRFFFRRSIKNPNNKIKFIENIKITTIEKAAPLFIDIPYEIKLSAPEETPDLITKPEGFHYVSKKLKDIIEKEDPNTHLFWRININNTNNKNLEVYLMQVGRIINIDSISDEGSLGEEKTELKRILTRNTEKAKKIEQIPIFTTKRLKGQMFISNKIKQELIEASLNGIWGINSKKSEILGECFEKIS